MQFCPRCSVFYPDEGAFCATCGADLERVKDPLIDKVIAGRYRVTKRLGTGGMSSVYLAEHVLIARKSAIKILRQDLARHPTHKERFLREARAVNRINHPNIVEISDLGEADGLTFLVMEYVDGPTLHEELSRGAMRWQRAARIGVQVASALARAHRMGVIHRDLKPENILLAKPKADEADEPRSRVAIESAEDLVKLTDFGIAKMTNEPSLTVGESLFGTPGYIAPEYVDGAEADARSDLYGLGVILYESTTGRLPYDEKGAALLTAPLRARPVPPTARVGPGYPLALESLVLALLARKPDDRPPHAFAVYDALLGMLEEDARVSLANTPSIGHPSFASFPSQASMRDEASTLVDESRPAPDTPPPAAYRRITSTSELVSPGGLATAQWRHALSALESAIAEAEAGAQGRRSPERIERAVELATLARAKVRSIDRASRVVVAQQAHLDALEREGKTFRADIGHALDQLALDRSRARWEAEVTAERLAAMAAGPPSDRTSDAVLWETAALSVMSGRELQKDEDLAFQIDALEARLREKNEAFEKQVALAQGALDASLETVRGLARELEALLAEATLEVGGPAEPVIC